MIVLLYVCVCLCEREKERERSNGTAVVVEKDSCHTDDSAVPLDVLFLTSLSSVMQVTCAATRALATSDDVRLTLSGRTISSPNVKPRSSKNLCAHTEEWRRG